ncbi:hypothetical protein [Thorsellia kenyensis]|uniref:Uncharacterized protein n=1 Tax=Thorsellia kenyensis TaxID=1549888 RepID=A0ABV6C932_9GAMM
MTSKLKKIFFPFIFILAICAICATVLVGFIIYTHDKDNPVTPEFVESILPPKGNTDSKSK